MFSNFNKLLFFFFCFPSHPYLNAMTLQLIIFQFVKDHHPNLLHAYKSNSSSFVEDVGEISLSALSRHTSTSFSSRTNVKLTSLKYNLINITSSHPRKPAKSLLTNTIYQNHITTFSQFLTTTILKLTNNIPFQHLTPLTPKQFKIISPQFTHIDSQTKRWLLPMQTMTTSLHQQIHHVLKLLSPKTPHIPIVNEENVDPIFSFSSSDEQDMSMESSDSLDLEQDNVVFEITDIIDRKEQNSITFYLCLHTSSDHPIWMSEQDIDISYDHLINQFNNT
jgi:hypothetical protein